MHTLAAMASATGAIDLDTFLAWLRITHFINFIMMGFLIRSGWEVIASHPRLYWNNHCTPGSEWLKFTKDKVSTVPGEFTARDDQRNLHPLISLPGRGQIGLGRAWHALVTAIWLINGFVYVALLFGTGQWRRIVPTSWSIFPEAWESAKIYMGLQIPSIEHFQPYDALQKLMYFTVVFIVAPLMIATGPIMSPTFAGRFPGYVKIFRNRQTARSIHFLGMAFYCFFVVMHVALWIGASYWSLSNLRRTQRWIWGATQPIRALTIDRLKSRQVAKKTFTEDDISPFHWVNTRPPTQEQSEEYIALRADDFKDFRLEIGGLVEEEKSFSIDELKALGKVTNITMHTCMQGWIGIAKWEGIRHKDLLEQVTPTEGAHYLMATSFGHVRHTYDGRPTEPYYECIDPSMIDDECILAWGMNDEPLPEVYGGPLRLRADSQHGDKMVKWVRRLEWIHDYHEVGDGQGGSREDSGLQHDDARA